MDLGTAIGLVLGLLTFAGTVAGVVKAYGMLQQRVADQAEELLEQRDEMKALGARIEKAEGAAAQTGKLADALEHLGERFAQEIKHLADVWSINHDHTRAQLDDIKERLNKAAST